MSLAASLLRGRPSYSFLFPSSTCHPWPKASILPTYVYRLWQRSDMSASASPLPINLYLLSQSSQITAFIFPSAASQSKAFRGSYKPLLQPAHQTAFPSLLPCECLVFSPIPGPAVPLYQSRQIFSAKGRDHWYFRQLCLWHMENL